MRITQGLGHASSATIRPPPMLSPNLQNGREAKSYNEHDLIGSIKVSYSYSYPYLILAQNCTVCTLKYHGIPYSVQQSPFSHGNKRV